MIYDLNEQGEVDQRVLEGRVGSSSQFSRYGSSSSVLGDVSTTTRDLLLLLLFTADSAVAGHGQQEKPSVSPVLVTFYTSAAAAVGWSRKGGWVGRGSAIVGWVVTTRM